MPIFCTFSRRMSSRPFGMMVSFTLASSRPSLPALSLAFFIWPSFSLLFDSAFSASRFCCFWNSTACGASIFTMRSALSASGGRGGSFSHMNTRMVAKMPSTMLVPSMYWTISGSSTRGRETCSGGSTQRISMRRSLPSAKVSLARSPRARSTSLRRDVGDRRRGAAQDQVALQLGRQPQHVAVAAGREQQEALLSAELRRHERRPLAGADGHLAAPAQQLVAEDLAAPDHRDLQRRLVAQRRCCAALLMLDAGRRARCVRGEPVGGGSGRVSGLDAKGRTYSRQIMSDHRFLSSALCCNSFMKERLSGADISSSNLTRFKK